jgi:hypothetical protein
MAGWNFHSPSIDRRKRHHDIDTRTGEARLGMIVHHTDAEREYAYDRDTEFGRLHKARDAAANKWVVIDMKNDWKRIFAFE